MGILVLAAAACSANADPESSSPVTSEEIPVIMEAQPAATPEASQVQPANIEQAAEANTLPKSSNEAVGESVVASSETDTSSGTTAPVLPRRLHVGGQARMLDAMQHRSAGVDEADIAKTITIDIRRDEQNRYYFEPLEPLEVPAGETVKFVVRNIHTDSSDCW